MVAQPVWYVSWGCPLSAVLQLDNIFEGLLACVEQLRAML